MAKVYVEARPKGRRDGAPVSDYIVEDGTERILGEFATQRQAIDWARTQGHSPWAARVRHLNDKNTPDHWREA